MDWRELVQEIGREFGTEVNNETADYILWQHTGFPAFFTGEPIECCKIQLREFFSSSYPPKLASI